MYNEKLYFLGHRLTIIWKLKINPRCKLNTEPDFFMELLDNLYDGVYFLDLDRKITYWNKGAERIAGYKSDEVIGTRCCDNILVHVNKEGVNLCGGECPVVKILDGGNPAEEEEVFLHHKDGYRVPVLVRIVPMRDENGEIIGGVEIFRDNSEKIVATDIIEDLKKQVFIDLLTGIPNRRYMEKVILDKLHELERYNWPFALTFIDIDYFKEINDLHGHDMGDLTLQMVANSLSHCSRSFDTIGRWGGDEFVGVIANIDPERLRMIAERSRVMIENSILTDSPETIRVTVSIGATLARTDDSLESLVKRADAMMYLSKLAGRNCLTLDGSTFQSDSGVATFNLA
jgi:diguanylate cyclase (GGDEF)-like protein/PAS domain S-box-containing protein